MVTNKQLARKLQKLGYKKDLIMKTIEDIRSTDIDIRENIVRYVNVNEIRNLVQPPVDVEMLMEVYNMNPIAAMLFIDWLRKDPNKALQCIMLGIDEITDVIDEECEEIVVQN